MRIKEILLALLIAVVGSFGQWELRTPGFEYCETYASYTFGGQHFAVVEGGAVYRRGFAGGAWEQSLPPMGEGAELYVGFFSKRHQLFVGGRDQGFYSNDTGKTWRQIDTLYNNFSYYEGDMFALGDTIYKQRNGAVSTSLDYGRTWSTFVHDFTFYGMARSESRLFLMGWEGLVVSEDGGKSHRTLTKGLPGRTTMKHAAELTDQHWVVSTDEGLYETFDGGVEWGVLDSSFSDIHHNTITDMAILDSTLFFLTTQGVLFRYSERERIAQLSCEENLGMRMDWIDTGNGSLLVSAYNGALCSDDFGTSWRAVKAKGLPVKRSIQEVFVNETGLYATYRFTHKGMDKEQDILFQSGDGGETWHHILTAAGENKNLNGRGEWLFCGDVYANYHGPNFYESFDRGLRWEVDSQEYRPLSGPTEFIGDTIISRAHFSIMFSFDSGKSWLKKEEQPISGAVAVGDAWILSRVRHNQFATTGNGRYENLDSQSVWYDSSDVIVQSFVHDTLWGFNDGKSYFSLDTARSWEAIASDEKYERLLHFGDGLILARASDDLSSAFYSLDQGRSWEQILLADSLRYNHNIRLWNDTLYYGEGSWVYKRLAPWADEQSPVIATAEGQALGVSVHTVGSVARISLPQSSGAVRCALYGLSGKELLRTALESSAGRSLSLNCAALARGVYLLKIEMSIGTVVARIRF